MSRTKKGNALGIAQARMRRVAAHVGPLAKNSRAVAQRGVHKTRARMAPTIERGGQAVEETIAPKVASFLSTAARRVAPDAPRRSRWRRPAGIAGLTAGAGATVVALVTRLRKPGDGAPGEPEDPHDSDR